MRSRDRRNRPPLSEMLRRSTEQRWTDDPDLNAAGGGPGCDDRWPHDDRHHHHHDHYEGNDYPDEDDVDEEWV